MSQKKLPKKRFPVRAMTFLLMLGMTIPLRAETRDWQNLFRSTDNALNGGQGYTRDPNGAVLAWNEGPLLKSYLQMFEAYHEPYYLRKLVTHFDQVQTHLKDWNGDGEWAWRTTNYTDEVLLNTTLSSTGAASVVLNVNPGFETVDASTKSLPAGWTRVGTSTQVYRSTNPEDRQGGEAGLVVKTNGTSWRYGKQNLAYVPGQSYAISFFGKTNGKVDGRVTVYDCTAGCVVLAQNRFSGTEWSLGRFNFKAPTVEGRNLQLWCFFYDFHPTDGQVSFDDVRVSLEDPSIAADWGTAGGLPETVQRVQRNDSPSPFHCLEVKADGDASIPAAEQGSLRTVPGAIYQLTVKSWGSARLEIWDGENRIAFAERGEQKWGDLSLTFTAPVPVSRTLTVRLTLPSNALGTLARFDDPSLKMETEYLVHQAVLLAPILRFVRLVRDDPALQGEFKEKAESYLDLALKKILPAWEKDWREKGNRGFYVSNQQNYFGRLGKLSDWSLPHNQYLPMAEVFLDLWHLTGDVKYRVKAEKLGQSFKTFLTIVNGRYLWHYADDLFQEGFDPVLSAEDMNHGNLDVSAVLRMAEDSVVFSSEDMRMFARTLLEVVWNGNINDPSMHSRVDGSDVVGHEIDYKYGVNEWVGLARHEPAVWPLVNRLYREISWGNGSRLLTVSGLAKFDPLQKPIERTAPGNVTATALSSTTVRVSWTPPAGPTLNANPGFESSNELDFSLPDGWTRSGTSTQVFRSTALEDRRFGNAGLVVKTDGIRWNNGIRGLAYTPGETYLVTFWGKTNGKVRGRIGIYDRAGGGSVGLKNYYFSNSEWTPMFFRFTAPSEAGRDIKLYCYFDDYRKTDGVVWFDEIRVSKDIISPVEYTVFQAGVEKASAIDSPLVLSGLTAGTPYSFSVVARDRDGFQSPQSFDAMVRTLPTSVAAPLLPFLKGTSPWMTVESARAYPVPFRPGRGADGITFDRLPAETVVRIYTIDGRPVKTLITNTESVVPWDLTNDDNAPVASGVYLAIVEKDGNRKRLKVVVQN